LGKTRRRGRPFGPDLVIALIASILIGLARPHVAPARADVYHVDSQLGDDGSDGRAPENAWKSLARASRLKYGMNDQLLLKRSCTFTGSLALRAEGTDDGPVIVAAYGEGKRPVIDARGHRAAVHLKSCRHVVVSGLGLTSDGGKPVEGAASDQRYGVLADTWSETPDGMTGIALEDLHIYDIYPTSGIPHEGDKPTTFAGYGIVVESRRQESTGLRIENCRIARTGFQGVSVKRMRDVQLLNNHFQHIGGPGMHLGSCQGVVVRGNTTDHTGSCLDKRMHRRGSGIWPWSCRDVLIEGNRFLHARGKADSCGAHIDFNCRDVVVQRNLSIDNEGGFVEILGNSHNCAYRYNISVNDGSRVKDRQGAEQDGKVLWTSGYVGSKAKPVGPFNNYIYNNTVFANRTVRSCFQVAPTTDGLLVANNIFHLEGETVALGVPRENDRGAKLPPPARAVFRNNLFLRPSSMPQFLPVRMTRNMFDNPGFLQPGGIAPEDYVAAHGAVIRDRGIRVERMPGDAVGVRRGLDAEVDFLGNPIVGPPDLGAIEWVDSEVEQVVDEAESKP
jgi:hypothetical protein